VRRGLGGDADAADPLAAELRIGVLANGFGVAWAFELPRLATRASVTVAAPLVDVRLNSDAPEASVERFGLADVFIQPQARLAQSDSKRSRRMDSTSRPERRRWSEAEA